MYWQLTSNVLDTRVMELLVLLERNLCASISNREAIWSRAHGDPDSNEKLTSPIHDAIYTWVEE